MAKEEKDANFRTLVIRNFRNLGPFCAGTKDDENDDKVFLKLNRSLSRDELGGLVILIGANNSGKSNVLDALDKFNTQNYSDSDFTDFTFASRVRPSVGMNVANGRYGKFGGSRKKSHGNGDSPGQGHYHISGQIPIILFHALMTSESYDIYNESIKWDTNNYKNLRAYIDEKLDFIRMNDWGIHSFFFEKFKINERVKIVEGEEFTHYLLHYVHDPKHSSQTSIESWYDADTELEAEIYGEPLEIDETDFPEAIKVLSSAKGSPKHRTVKEDTTSDFYAAYGYNLSNNVYRYERKRIHQSDFSCKPDALNGFLIGLLDMMGYERNCIKNSYGGISNLRFKLEKEMNRDLEAIAGEFNDILNINEKKYGFQMNLEKENIEFLLTYGDDVPLNLDRQSEGFTWIFDMFFNLIKSNEFHPGDIITFDEFGNSLGFSTVGELIKKLRAYGKRNGLTFVLATQNPMAVDIMHLDEVRLVVPKDDGSSHIENEFDHFVVDGDHDLMRPVINGLMVSRNFLRTENRRTVFVEGVTDYFYLNSFSEILRDRGEDVDVDFIPMNGLGKYKDSPIEVLDQLRAVEHDPLMFIDSDSKGEQFRKAAEKKGIKPSSIAEIFGGEKKVIEDLFSKEDAESLRILPKSFDRTACLSYRLPELYDSLSEETRSNFGKVIRYVMMM